MKRIESLFCVGCLFVGSLQAAVEVRPEGPIRSLRAAFDALRGLGPAEERRILVHDGNYVLSDSLVLTAADGGTAAQPVIVEAAPGARPVFSGGTRLPPMQRTTNGSWQLKVPSSLTCEQLYVGGKAAVRARTPNLGSQFVMKSVEEQEITEAVEEFKAGAYQFVALDDKAAAAVPAEPVGIWVTAFHKWDMTRRRILGAEEGTLVIGPGKMKSWNPLRDGTRFFLENHPSFLDAAGEWYLTDDSVLHYLPRAGETPSEVAVIAPRLTRLVHLAGIPAAPVSHIQFRGLTFAHNAYNSKPDGLSPAQAANGIGAAIEADYAHAVQFVDCVVRETATYGVWFREGCRNCEIRGCELTELGGGGIRIGPTSGRPKGMSLSRSNLVADNKIHRGGILFPPAVGVLIGHAADNEVTHNEIAHLSYSGVSVGWVWGYGESVAANNRITWNHLHHLGGLLSDLGAVYTLGKSPGTVVSHNLIHDVSSHSYGGWGLYNDEGSTGIVMENNIVYNTKTGGYHQHYGRENMIRNNIFYNASQYQLQFTRPEKHQSFAFERNIVLYDKGKLLQGAAWQKGKLLQNRNCYWNLAGEVNFPTGDLASWQALGRDVDSIVANPKLRSPQTGDFSVLEGSPVEKIGFVPFSLKGVGPR